MPLLRNGVRQTMELLLRSSCTLKWAAEEGGTAAAEGLCPPSHEANAQGFHVPKLELLLRGVEGLLAWHRPSLPQHQHCKECSDMLLDHLLLPSEGRGQPPPACLYSPRVCISSG